MARIDSSVPEATPLSPSSLPARLGGYEIVRRIGVGGMSEVLLAVASGPHGFRRQVVIKRLLPGGLSELTDEERARMLAREATACARLTHPAIVRLFDFFEADGQPALVLEYVDGPSLSRLRSLLRARGARLADAPACYIAHRVFEGLAAAHDARDPETLQSSPVVHRDVSPGNVLVPWDGFVKLTDFGIAKIAGTISDTRAGFMKGTYGYMAPEQVRGHAVSPRTDVFTACVLLREMLTWTITFPRGRLSELEFLGTMAEPSVAPIRTLRPDLPRSLADAIDHGLEANPALRTISAKEMAASLRALVDLERAREDLVAVLSGLRGDAERHDVERRLSLPTPAAFASAVVPVARTTLPLRTPLPPRLTTPETPEAILRDVLTSDTERFIHPPPKPRDFQHLSLAAAACAGLLVVALVARLASRGHVEAAVEAATLAPLVATPLPPVAPSDRPAIVLNPARPEASVDGHPAGDIVIASSPPVQSVLLDGRFVNVAADGVIHVRCGRHMIRVRNGVRAQHVDVPCGGSAEVK
jgi:serine/threonine protein kinase